MLLRAGLAVVFAITFLVAPPFLGASVRAMAEGLVGNYVAGLRAGRSGR